MMECPKDRDTEAAKQWDGPKPKNSSQESMRTFDQYESDGESAVLREPPPKSEPGKKPKASWPISTPSSQAHERGPNRVLGDSHYPLRIDWGWSLGPRLRGLGRVLEAGWFLSAPLVAWATITAAAIFGTAWIAVGAVFFVFMFEHLREKHQ